MPRLDLKLLPRPPSGALALTVLVALGLLFFWPFLTPDARQRRSIAEGDFTNQFYPYHAYTAAELHRGRLPLWNPYLFGGHPFQADPQTAVFAPLTLLTALVAGSEDGLSYFAMELRVLANYGLAALFMYLLAQRLTGSPWGAFYAALAYTFSGYLLSYPMVQLPILETAAWAPLVFYLLDRAATAQRWSAWAAGAGLAYGAALLAGHGQTALFLGYAALVYGVWRTWERGPRRALASAALFLGFGVGLAAVQLLPTLEFTGRSTRAYMPYDIAASGFDLLALPGMLLPGWRRETPLYVGIATLLLAAIGIARPWPGRGPWLALGLGGLLLAVGRGTFFYRALYTAVPGFALFQHQERAIFLVVMALTLFAGRGLAALFHEGHSVRELLGGAFRHLPGVGLVLFGGLLLVLVQRQNYAGQPNNPFNDLMNSYVFFLLVLALALALLAAWARGGVSGPVAAGLAALTVLDLFTISAGNNSAPGMYEARTRLPQVRSVLAAQEAPGRVELALDTALPGAYAALARLESINGDSPIGDLRLQTLLAAKEEQRRWELLNVTYLLTRERREGDPSVQWVLEEEGMILYRVVRTLPRAYAVGRYEVIGDPKAALAQLLRPEHDPRTTAILEAEPPVPPGAPLDARAEVSWVRREPQRLVLRTRAQGPALIVLSEPYDPGWRASLDGRDPLPVLRANYALRAVVVPAGEHLVEMVYRPTPLVLGAAVSGATLLLAGAIFVLHRQLP